MKIYFWTKQGQAYINIVEIVKETARSIFVKMLDGSRRSILRKDIIAIEEVN